MLNAPNVYSEAEIRRFLKSINVISWYGFNHLQLWLPESPANRLNKIFKAMSSERMAEEAIDDALAGCPEQRYEDRLIFPPDPTPLQKGFEDYLKSGKLDQPRLQQIIKAMALHSNEGWEAFAGALGRASAVEGETAADRKLAARIKKAAQAVSEEMYHQCVHELDQPLGPGVDLGAPLLQLERIFNLFSSCKLDPPEEVKDFSTRFYQKLFHGCDFSMTLPSLPMRRSLVPNLGAGSKNAQRWAKSCPSEPIVSSFGRADPVSIGNEEMKKWSASNQLESAYRYNQALAEYLGEKGIANPQATADRLMLLGVMKTCPVTYLQFPRHLAGLYESFHGEGIDFVKNGPLQRDPVFSFSVENGKCILRTRSDIRYIDSQTGSPIHSAMIKTQTEFDPENPDNSRVEHVTIRPIKQGG